MRPSMLAMLSMLAASGPVPSGGASLNLLPSELTIEAARLGEFGPDVPAANRKTDRRKRKAGNARKARRGWR